MSDETKPAAVDLVKETPAAPASPAGDSTKTPTLASIPRTFEKIQQEYLRVVQELGQLSWQIKIHEATREGLYAKLQSLGEEASKLPEEKKAPKLAPVPAPPKAGADGT